MARQHYNITGTNPAGADQTPATALTRLRNLEAVDRFTGVNLVDGGNNGLTFTTDETTVTSAVTFGAGNTVFYNKAIRMGAGGTITANAAGAHIYFVNCTIFHEVSSGLNSAIGTGVNSNDGTIDARVGQGAGATRSINYYGCTIVAPQFLANNRIYVSDIINSEYISWQGRRSLIDFGAQGSRLINTTGVGPSGDAGAGLIVTYYGAPEIFEGYRASFTQIEATDRFGANQAILIEPNFTSLEAGQRYRMQAAGLPDRAYQVIGPYNPPSNVNNADVLGTGYVWQAGANTGGVINYYGWQPGFFEDLAQTVGIEGVNVRVETSATLAATGVNTRASGDFDSGIGNQSISTVDLTGAALNHIVDYKTADTGLAVVGANTQYAADGSTFVTGQWIDWLRLGVYNATGYTTAPTTELAQNFLNQPAPDGCVIAPISLVRNSSYNQFNSRFRVRSYSHDLEIEDTQNGTVGDADGNQTANAVSPIDTTNYIAANLIGTRVKTTNVDAANQPDISFDGTQTASLQDLGNIARDAWARYTFEPNFDGGSLRPSAGPFDERTYPIRPVVVTSDPSSSSGAFHTGPGFAVSESNGQLRISVWCQGIAPDTTNDVLGQDPFTTSFNSGNTPLSITEGTVLTTIGGCVNMATLTGGEINNTTNGAVEFSRISETNAATGVAIAADDETRVTGNVIINQTGAGGIENLPPFLGRLDGSDTITIENSDFESTGNEGIYTAAPGGAGLYNNSRWTGVTTLSAVDWNMLRTITFNAGCNLEGTVSVAANEDSTWTFNALPATLDLNIPATQTSLVRINTNNQAGDETIYDGVKTWLDAKIGSGNYSNVRLDETAPTTGYWLPAPPLQPAEPRTYRPGGYIQNDNTVTDGATPYVGSINQLGGFFGYSNGTTVTTVEITDATTLDDITIDTNNEDPLTYTIWYKPSNVVDTTSGAGFLVTQTTWIPASQDNGTTVASPIANVLLSTAYAAGTQATHFVANNALESGVAEYTISGFESTAAGPDETQAMALEIANTRLFFDAVTTAGLTQAQQLVEFGLNQTTNFNGGTIADTVVPNLIRLTATNQNQVAAASGILSEALGSATAVISASVLQPLATTAQVAALASGASTEDLNSAVNELKANQGKLATDVRRASLLQPGSGTIPNTAD